MIPTYHLETLFWSAVIVTTGMCFIATVAGCVMFLMYRDRDRPVPATGTAVPRVTVARDRTTAETPAAVAG